VFERISLRVASGLLLATVALLTACEPDECDVNFAYEANVGGVANLFAYVWRYPTTDCSLTTGLGTGGSSFGGTTISYVNGDQSLTIALPVGGLQEGAHVVQIIYMDDDRRTWSSTTGGLPGEVASGCVAALETVESVDWMIDDHMRISGVVQCAGPLIRVAQLGSSELLRFSELRFNIYSSSFGLI